MSPGVAPRSSPSPHGDTHPPIFRAPMRSRTIDAHAGAGADFAVHHGLVGIGERLDTTPPTPAEAILGVARAHGEKAGRLLARFIGLPDGTFVWTRQSDGAYRLGQITGRWMYDDSPAARAVGIHHVRPARWSARRFHDGDVPGGVAHAFARGGRNLQRTHDRSAERQTAAYWNRDHAPELP
jgi:hypothetical protein